MPEKGSQQDPQDEADLQSDQAETTDNLPENTVAVEDVGTLRKKITVTIQRERIDAKLDEMFGELSGTAMVPGFRIGRAPRRLIEKRFGKDVSQDVRNALVGDSIGSAIEKGEFRTLGEPDIDLEKIKLPETGEMSFSFEVEVAPDFELPELKGIKVTKTTVEIDDEQIDEQLDRWRQSQARFEPTDEAAEEADTVIADARISGEGIDELHRKDLTLRVAPGQVEGLPLVDLGESLTGRKSGDQAVLTVNVPEAHPNEEWRGKKLTVELTIGQVSRRIMPEIDEEFAAGAGFESLTDLRGFLAKNLELRAVQESRRALHKQVSDYLLENTEFDLPEGVAARHTAQTLQRRYVQLLQAGVPREKIDENLTELQAAATEQAKHDLKLSMILGKIADQESIEVTEDEVNAAIAAMARQYNRRPERLRQELQKDGAISPVESSIREEKAIEKLLETAEITEAPTQEEQQDTQTQSKD